MLNDTQKEQFCNATAQWNSGTFGDECAWVCEIEDVVATRDTIQGFKDGLANGEPDEIEETEVGTLLIWKNRQKRKGARRGDLFVLDFGDTRAAYFGGE